MSLMRLSSVALVLSTLAYQFSGDEWAEVALAVITVSLGFNVKQFQK